MMARRTLSATVLDIADTIGSIIAASAAAEAGRAPRARDLRRIGIDPAAFHRLPR